MFVMHYPDGWMNGWGWGMMGLGWLIIVILVGFVAWAIIGSNSGSRRHDPMDLLDERLARGELSPEDYRERRNILEDVHR